MCIRSSSFAKLLRRPFHDFLHCALCVTRGVHRIESIRPTGPPVRGVTSTATCGPVRPCGPVPFAVTGLAHYPPPHSKTSHFAASTRLPITAFTGRTACVRCGLSSDQIFRLEAIYHIYLIVNQIQNNYLLLSVRFSPPTH